MKATKKRGFSENKAFEHEIKKKHNASPFEKLSCFGVL